MQSGSFGTYTFAATNYMYQNFQKRSACFIFFLLYLFMNMTHHHVIHFVFLKFWLVFSYTEIVKCY